MSEEKPKKIVFVCTGNTCRSPMAEYLMKKALRKVKLRGFKVCSAGVQAMKGDGMNPKSMDVLAENGIAVKNFKATRVEEKLLREGFVFICMTERHRDFLMDMRWHAMRKSGAKDVDNNVFSFQELVGYDVPDPYGMDIDAYRRVYAMLEGGMYEIIKVLDLAGYALPTKPKATQKKTEKGDGTPKKRGRPRKNTANT